MSMLDYQWFDTVMAQRISILHGIEHTQVTTCLGNTCNLGCEQYNASRPYHKAYERKKQTRIPGGASFERGVDDILEPKCSSRLQPAVHAGEQRHSCEKVKHEVKRNRSGMLIAQLLAEELGVFCPTRPPVTESVTPQSSIIFGQIKVQEQWCPLGFEL